MRHRKAGYKLGRTTSHRTATLRNLAMGLFEHGQITTTIQRAKAVQPMVEKIITVAKRGDIHSRRLVAAKLGRDHKAFTWMYTGKYATDVEKEIARRVKARAEVFFNVPDESTVERNRYGDFRKAPRIVKHIFENVASRYKDRAGGYTRIVKLAKFRIGDAGQLCVLQLVGNEEGPEIGGNLSRRRRMADKRTAFAKQVRDGFAKKTD